MKIPIVMAAFGTTTKAMNTYNYIHRICKERFPGHPLYWAFSSRMVRDWTKQREQRNMLHPHQVLNKLEKEGHTWAVVQSMHLMCGHEFYRLTEEVKSCGIRTSLGLPLLTEPEDYCSTVKIFTDSFPHGGDEALLMVGHGTDHPGWCSYVALHHIFQENRGRGIFVGVVEKNGYPSRASVIRCIKETGYKKVRIIPFMLVAGMHFREDLTGKEDSWQKSLEEEGIYVEVETKGLGFCRGIVELYCRHIENALDVIPCSSQSGDRIQGAGIGEK
ncbi:MAG: sirohydrochlorin cobaltochelatase [Desulfococcaceae bacterium]|jgi:sirohydrochlorin cobaltochelatase|nr:sirohydrochlorin cobaltochelatase [Desulfococcaceae bacterium]